MRRGPAYAYIAIVLALGGIAVTLVLAGPEEPPLHGIVLDSLGKPLPGAEVTLRTPRGGCVRDPAKHRFARTETDPKGRFSLPDPPGEMEFYVAHPDHAPAWKRAEEGAVIRLQAPSFLEITLNASAEVIVARGQWRFFRAISDGTIRCGPLPAGVVLDLQVDSPAHRPHHEVLELRENETRRMRIELERGHSIWGEVRPPAAGVEVRAHQADGHESVTTTRADGTFELTGLAAGAARIVALAEDRPVLVVDTNVGETVELRWDR